MTTTRWGWAPSGQARSSAKTEIFTYLDPQRHPTKILKTLGAKVGGQKDKLLVGNMRQELTRKRVEELLRAPDMPTRQRLREAGFSTEMIQSFFRPFFVGVFLDRELKTSLPGG